GGVFDGDVGLIVGDRATVTGFIIHKRTVDDANRPNRGERAALASDVSRKGALLDQHSRIAIKREVIDRTTVVAGIVEKAAIHHVQWSVSVESSTLGAGVVREGRTEYLRVGRCADCSAAVGFVPLGYISRKGTVSNRQAAPTDVETSPLG